MTGERISTGGDRLHTGQAKEAVSPVISVFHTRALAQSISRDPTIHSREAILATMFAHEPEGFPKRAQQRAFTLLAGAVGELRRNRKKLTSKTEKDVLGAIDAITDANEGNKAAFYRLLKERVGIFPPGYHNIVIPETMAEVALPPLPGEVTQEEVRANLRLQLDVATHNPALIDWVHINVLRTRFRRELHGMRLDRGKVPKPDEGGFYSSIDAAIIFCLAEFQGRELPVGLNMRQMANEILTEK